MSDDFMDDSEFIGNQGFLNKHDVIEYLSLKSLNVSEYLHHAKRTYDAALTAGAEVLFLPPATLPAYLSCINNLTRLIDFSHASTKTKKLHELDDSRNELAVFLNGEVRNGLKSPFLAKREAAEALYLILKPFIGVQKLAMNQKTAHIRGIHEHLSEAPASEYLALLGLTSVLDELVVVNEKYDALSKERSEEEEEKHIDNSFIVRGRSDILYHNIITFGGSAALIKPSPAATQFVASMNALVKYTKTTYNQRMGQLHSHPDKEPITTEEATTEA